MQWWLHPMQWWLHFALQWSALGGAIAALRAFIVFVWTGKKVKPVVISPSPPVPFAREVDRYLAGEIGTVSLCLRIDQLFEARLAELRSADTNWDALDWATERLEPSGSWRFEGDRLERSLVLSGPLTRSVPDARSVPDTCTASDAARVWTATRNLPRPVGPDPGEEALL